MIEQYPINPINLLGININVSLWQLFDIQPMLRNRTSAQREIT